MNPRKNEQLTGRIRILLADILSREISDPRLGDVVISRIELASDGSFARIFVSSFEDLDEESSKVKIKILKKASGYIRKLLSGRLQVRIVPELRFVWDDSVKEGERVLSLLRSMKKKDE